MVKPEIRPVLAMLTDKLPGCRRGGAGSRQLYSRNGNDVSAKYPSICEALSVITLFALNGLE
jgi:hypothetical protein